MCRQADPGERQRESRAIGLLSPDSPRLKKWRIVAREMEREASACRSIGGAHHSRAHTAVKIAPNDRPVVYVPDASARWADSKPASDRASAKNTVAGVARRYENIRINTATRKGGPAVALVESAAPGPRHRLVQLSAARRRAPPVPVCATTRWARLVSYIDWTPFFQAGDFPARIEDLQVPVGGGSAQASCEALESSSGSCREMG